MEIPSVDSCCYINLRMAGLIIGWFGIILGGLMFYLETHWWEALIDSIFLSLHVYWLVGIYRHNRYHMLALLFVLPIFLMAGLIGVFALSIMAIIPVEPGDLVEKKENIFIAACRSIQQLPAVYVAFYTIVLAAIVVLYSWFYVVEYSLYKLMKNVPADAPIKCAETSDDAA